MVAYNFQGRFEAPILAGKKRSTIRPMGKRAHAAPGQELHLYTGMRTPDCRLLMRVPCAAVTPIRFTAACVMVLWGGAWSYMGRRSAEAADLAAAEGFASPADMFAWFEDRYGFPTDPMMRIQWEPRSAVFVAGAGREVVQ